MRIKYEHVSDPDAIKIYDTEEVLENNPAIKRNFYGRQKEFDESTLKKFEEDKTRGLILQHEILPELQELFDINPQQKGLSR